MFFTLQGTTEDGITGGIILDLIGTTIETGTYTGDYINFLYVENSGVVYNSIPAVTGFLNSYYSYRFSLSDRYILWSS